MDSMRSGLEVEETGEGLEVDSMDEIGTAEGLHEDLWGSVRYIKLSPINLKVSLAICLL